MPSSPTIADIFCGAGGLALGFKRAGFSVLYSADCWSSATETYKANLGHLPSVRPVDISLKIPAVDVIVGGPPCQGFSSAGARRAEDPRNSLVEVFAMLIARHRPRAFVFENVEGFLT